MFLFLLKKITNIPIFCAFALVFYTMVLHVNVVISVWMLLGCVVVPGFEVSQQNNKIKNEVQVAVELSKINEIDVYASRILNRNLCFYIKLLLFIYHTALVRPERFPEAIYDLSLFQISVS